MEGNILYYLKLFMPVIVIELILKAFCFYSLSKDEVKHLPKVAWFFIILFINTLGPVIYLLAGRKRD